MGLVDGGSVLGSPSYSIKVAHDVLELVESAEDVDTYTSVEACWFEQPQILLTVHAVAELVHRLDALLPLDLHLIHLSIDQLNRLVQILVNDLEDVIESFYFVANIVFQVVEHYGHG